MKFVQQKLHVVVTVGQSRKKSKQKGYETRELQGRGRLKHFGYERQGGQERSETGGAQE